jgi:hypothetical protein
MKPAFTAPAYWARQASKGNDNAVLPACIATAKFSAQRNSGSERPISQWVGEAETRRATLIVQAEDEPGRRVPPALIELAHAALEVIQVDGLCKVRFIALVSRRNTTEQVLEKLPKAGHDWLDLEKQSHMCGFLPRPSYARVRQPTVRNCSKATNALERTP